MASRQNQWFIPGEGIAREVITADIGRYLGPDALVRPGVGTGEHEGVNGYYITAYRNLTAQMLVDLRMDSQRWRQEEERQRESRTSLAAYHDSRTHASRQYYGPTSPDTGRTASESSSSIHSTSSPPATSSSYPPASYYTSPQPGPPSTTPYAQYGYPPSEYGGYQPPRSYAPSQSSYSSYPPAQSYSQPPSGYSSTPSSYGYPQSQSGYSTAPSSYGYPQAQSEYSTGQTPYGYGQPPPTHQQYRYQSSPPPTQGYAQAGSAATPGQYVLSDGRQYPLPPSMTPYSASQQQQPRHSPYQLSPPPSHGYAQSSPVADPASRDTRDVRGPENPLPYAQNDASMGGNSNGPRGSHHDPFARRRDG